MTTVELLKDVSIVLGATTAVLGIVGGLLSLPLQVRRLRKDLQPFGNKEVSARVISREDSCDELAVTFIVAGDLFHFMGSFGKEENLGRVRKVEPLGEYYKVLISYPPGSNPHCIKTKKKSRTFQSC